MKVAWAKTAVIDLRNLERYIAVDSAFYARRFVVRILQATRQLEA